MPYEFEDLFTFQGWMKFSKLNEYYYPYLIQEFYGYMKEVVKRESFSVKVKKKSQIINVDFLASVLNLPNDGIGLEPLKILGSLKDIMRRLFNYQFFQRVHPKMK